MTCGERWKELSKETPGPGEPRRARNWTGITPRPDAYMPVLTKAVDEPPGEEVAWQRKWVLKT